MDTTLTARHFFVDNLRWLFWVGELPKRISYRPPLSPSVPRNPTVRAACSCGVGVSNDDPVASPRLREHDPFLLYVLSPHRLHDSRLSFRVDPPMMSLVSHVGITILATSFRYFRKDGTVKFW